jgi:hypothetical protein
MSQRLLPCAVMALPPSAVVPGVSGDDDDIDELSEGVREFPPARSLHPRADGFRLDAP